MALEDGKGGEWFVKNLERAREDYAKKKEKAEQLQARAAEAVRKMKQAEADLIEAENMEIIRIVRETNMTVSELMEWKANGMTGLPGMAVPEEEERTHDYNEEENAPY